MEHLYCARHFPYYGLDLQVLIALHREMERSSSGTHAFSAGGGRPRRSGFGRNWLRSGMRERSADWKGTARRVVPSVSPRQRSPPKCMRTGWLQADPAEAEKPVYFVGMTQQAITQSRQVASGLLLSGITPQTLIFGIERIRRGHLAAGARRLSFRATGRPRVTRCGCCGPTFSYRAGSSPQRAETRGSHRDSRRAHR